MWQWSALVSVVSLASCITGSLKRDLNAGIPSFGSGKSVGTILDNDIREVSGLAASHKHPGILYAHNDHGDGPRIFAINAADGSYVATFTISGAEHHDWEDIAVAPCEDGSIVYCIYIADTGSGNSQPRNVIYKVEEPDTLADGQALIVKSSLQFSWKENESETLLVDNHGEVYVIGRITSGRGMIVQLPNTAWGDDVPVQVSSSDFLPIHTHHNDPLAGDINPNGTEILVKARYHIYYWTVNGNGIISTLKEEPHEVPYIHESLGEAVCWSSDGSNYYTLSEGSHKPLYEYQRLPGTPGVIG